MLLFRSLCISIDSKNLNLSKIGGTNPMTFKRPYFYWGLKSKQLKCGKCKAAGTVTLYPFNGDHLRHSGHFCNCGNFGHGGHFGPGGHFGRVKNGDYLGNDDLLDFDQSKLDFVKN